MGRPNQIVERLRSGETVQYRPHGSSMTPRIKSGQLVTVVPVKLEEVQQGDAVLCRVNGQVYLHLVQAVGQDGRLKIGNNHGHTNGWTKVVFGKLVAVEP